MATQVLIAHTGQRLHLDTSQLASLDDFRASVSRQSSIPVQCIVALTKQGKPVKPQNIQTEKDICVYDIRISQAASPGSSPSVSVELPLPKRYNVLSPPNTIDDTRSLQSWQELFKARRDWAMRVVKDCSLMAQATQERYSEMDAMMTCLDAAVANLEEYVKTIEPRYQELQRWVPAAQEDYGALVTRWEQYLGLARNIPISPDMVRFMTGRNLSGGKGKPSRQTTLEDLVDLETARKAGRMAPGALRKFNQRMAELDKTANRMFQGCQDLIRDFEHTVARSTLSHEGESAQLLQDIDAVAKKIDTDYQTTLEYSTSTRDVLQASKIAANHTERLLPSIRNRALEMDEMLRYATQARNALAAESVDFMRRITDVNSLSTSVKSQINIVNQEEELTTFDYLRLIQQVPYMYATFIVEAIKRREWYQKVKADSSTLANEMALFQDEEIKRRRKWHKSIAGAYGPDVPSGENNVPGLEVNLLGEEEEWPSMTKKDLEEFIETLQRQKADPELVSDIGKLISELTNPTKQQSKRLKAFKNGSIHEAALGRSGLLIRGDDEVLRALQEDKGKLENKLKTAESRVRRLEDLLHRQSQASRPTLGNLFQTPSQQLSERNDSTISVRSPRISDDRRQSSDSTAAEGLLQRIQHLEGELATERERSAVFEKESNHRATQQQDLKGQMEEANSTKKDLLENMEALKKEFIEERKSLEDEIKRLHARLEDTEDEIEHFGESRENEKATYDEKVHFLEEEVERLAKERKDEMLKTQGQVDFLRNESRLQRERVNALEKQLQAAREEAKSMADQLEKADEVSETQLRTLRELHGQLSPNDAVPDDLGDLVDSVTSKSADVLSKIQDAERGMSLLKADLDLAHNTVKDLKGEVSATKSSLSSEETVSLRLRETLAEERAKVSALEGELAAGREQLKELRVKIADGETGSETLRKKLEDGEKKITAMAEELATKQSQVGSLEEELRLCKDRLGETEASMESLTGRFEARTERAKDLTQRLYSQNDRLCRLLERLGFSVTRQGSNMSIQKVPRSERSSQNPNDSSDPGSSIRRSGTLGRALADSADLELLYWMNASDSEAEAEKYDAYMSALGGFDMDAFSDTIYRRVKDIEHMARKLQRDARSYREKAHALQKEAHDKIAFRNFKEGDLALFLPTRNQTTGAWAAFNIGFPHYFLREQESHRLRNREWLLARIARVQERVVDLSKSLHHQQVPPGGTAVSETDSLNDEENDNPFDLSDGLRWYLIDAQEDKAGAPSTPGLAKSTVAANNVEAVADMRTHARTGSGKGLGLVGRGHPGIDVASKSLSKSLESRRSSTNSRKAVPFATGAGGRGSALASETNSLRAAAADTPVPPTSPTMQHNSPPKPHAQSATPGPVGAGEQGSAARPSPEAAVNGQQRQGQQPPVQTPEGRRLPKSQLQREVSAASVESPSKKSVVWDSLWSLDVSYEGGRKGK
ncbi:Autophagy-related protein 11 [Pleurostoma richardsiae]|uniref:Autophagy-related protein 11 n=1 Tax=Pleurostoma richardsiae TaxID=41990 RepID=A0AA38RV95_9PEZI|nr:Autophagy-related protein 11 [Pleurostoma richardsiae]